ncbi:anther-specific proline-rich protein APG-like [Iris pallida]|uniref:Anther-specific proline-rich protein APG-like n=1 Tax=Iris pallida TaxID=29817 RepID=A0AAX6FLC2_IRIPA|nr:anther-specific proline-rich protein APG-like [Iris pallida]KAJ6795759.1 anther-specific proline-rich protein APG-like [Iris pallida]KAJ6817138.1 anther-specific proline-rich protein APG-like [Iris pallida]KAJ6817139.1 anther-specific proline-rich protein APG-like [Iris pallida]KAJ6817140.1 anther-specific proline-rich protein APG-like [Iris pallida]
MGSSVLFGFSSDQTFGLITFRPPELMKGEVSSPSYSGNPQPNFIYKAPPSPHPFPSPPPISLEFVP